MVQIQSKQERGLIADSLRNFVPDILVSWAGAYLFNLGFPGFFGILICLQCLYLGIWIKNLIWMWLLFWLSGRKKLASHLEDFLYKNRFPQPPEFVGDIDDYLSQVANNQMVQCALRVKAAIELGTMVGIKTAGRYSLLMQLHYAFEDALEEYSRRFPPRNDGE